MGTLSRILGLCSFIFAGLVMCNVVYTFGVADWSDAGEDTLGGMTAAFTAAILLAQVGFALLLSTVGAAAWCVGDMAEEAAAAAHYRRAAVSQYDQTVLR